MWRALPRGSWKTMVTQASSAQPAAGLSLFLAHPCKAPIISLPSASQVKLPQHFQHHNFLGKFVGMTKFWGCGWGSWTSQGEFLCRTRAGGVTEALKQNSPTQAESRTGGRWAGQQFGQNFIIFCWNHSWAGPFQLLPLLEKSLLWENHSQRWAVISSLNSELNSSQIQPCFLCTQKLSDVDQPLSESVNRESINCNLELFHFLHLPSQYWGCCSKKKLCSITSSLKINLWSIFLNFISFKKLRLGVLKILGGLF